MSGAIGGSGYGLGYYGKGPYGYATRILGFAGASAVRVKGSQVILQAQLNIVGAGAVWFSPEILWAAIDVPPCQPWETISAACCPQAVPNSAGAMFPGAVLP